MKTPLQTFAYDFRRFTDQIELLVHWIPTLCYIPLGKLIQCYGLGPRVQGRCCRVTSLLVSFNGFAKKRDTGVETWGQWRLAKPPYSKEFGFVWRGLPFALNFWDVIYVILIGVSLGKRLAALDLRVGPTLWDSQRRATDHCRRLRVCFRVMVLGHAVDLEAKINQSHPCNETPIKTLDPKAGVSLPDWEYSMYVLTYWYLEGNMFLKTMEVLCLYLSWLCHMLLFLKLNLICVLYL